MSDRKCEVCGGDGRILFGNSVWPCHCRNRPTEAAAFERGRAAGLEEAARLLLNGSFLHDEAPGAQLAREAAAAIRALASTPSEVVVVPREKLRVWAKVVGELGPEEDCLRCNARSDTPCLECMTLSGVAGACAQMFADFDALLADEVTR